MKKKQGYRIIADPRAMAMAIAFVIVLVPCSLSAAVWEMKEFIHTGDKSGIIPSWIGGGCLCVAAIVSFVLLMKQMCVRITFAADAVTIHPLFTKPVRRPYKYYPYVFKGGYWHGSPIGVGKWVDYIVLSHGYIKNDDLMRINALGKDNDVIRIRYRRKNYDRFLAALPIEMAHKVKACFPES